MGRPSDIQQARAIPPRERPTGPTATKGNKEEETMAKDPVCGMQVDPTKAAGTSEYQGKTYVFCSAGCKRKFDSNPAQYTST
jgi:YHS domain-containing protein